MLDRSQQTIIRAPKMLEECTIKERWSGVNDMIERWLEERQALIVQYCGVSGVHQFSPNQSHRRLEGFCQILVDYVSAGHFEIYYQLLREAEEFKDGSAELAKALFPQLNTTTEAALAFNDNYSNVKPKEHLEGLTNHLSKLGETLESRFELEDRLIEVMHDAHHDAVQA